MTTETVIFNFVYTFLHSNIACYEIIFLLKHKNFYPLTIIIYFLANLIIFSFQHQHQIGRSLSVIIQSHERTIFQFEQYSQHIMWVQYL